MADLPVYQFTEQTVLADNDVAYNSPLVTATRRDRFVQKSNERRYHALKFVNVQTLSGNLTLASTDAYNQYLDPNGANRDVTLDATLEVTGRQIFVRNTSAGAFTISVKNSAAAMQGVALNAGQAAWYVWSGTAWVIDYLKGSSGVFAAGTAALPGVQVGATTVGLFSGSSGATEFLGLSANGVEFIRGLSTSIAMNSRFSPLIGATATIAGLASPTEGMVAYDSTLHRPTFYMGSAWSTLLPVLASGNVILGGTTDRASRLHLFGLTNAIMMGNTEADTTNKTALIGALHYTVAEGIVQAVAMTNSVSNSTVMLGGGQATRRAATALQIWLAANNVTDQGTERIRVSTVGFRIQVAGISASPAFPFAVVTAGDALAFQVDEASGCSAFGVAPTSTVKLRVRQGTVSSRIEFDASNYLQFATSSVGVCDLVSTGTAPFLRCIGATILGNVLTQLQPLDTTTTGAGVGAAIALAGNTVGAGTVSQFAAIKGSKANATSANDEGNLELYARVSGGNLTKGVTLFGGSNKFCLVGALGVGNSAAATVAVGALAKKMEVFDAAGTSLGFIPIYSTIT